MQFPTALEFIKNCLAKHDVSLWPNWDELKVINPDLAKALKSYVDYHKLGLSDVIEVPEKPNLSDEEIAYMNNKLNAHYRGRRK